MNQIIQPTTITDIRRDPKGILTRLKKEKVLPILVHSKYEAAFIDIEELNRLYEELKTLRHELFAEETLQAEKEYADGKYSGPFDTVESLMKHLNKKIDEEEG